MKKFIAIIMVVISLVFCLSGCMRLTREADKVNHNMNIAADNFGCERRITVYNARTDKIIMYAEGYMSINNNAHDEMNTKRTTYI